MTATWQMRIPFLCMLVMLGACSDDSQRAALPSATASASASASPMTTEALQAALADAGLGRQLVERYECHRCHDGTGLEAMPQEKSCVTCHQAIIAGTFEAPPAALKDWRGNILHLRHVPTLAFTAAVFREDWLAKFLQAPHDLRPNLPASMPRLSISDTDARHIAAYLTKNSAEPSPVQEVGDVERGRDLFGTKQCGSCHAFTGANAPAVAKHDGDPRRLEPAVLLAPDLRHARERLRPDALVEWLRDPQRKRPHSLMPRTPLSELEAEDLAAFILRVALAEPAAKLVPTRLPVLERRVAYEEVSKEVFKKVCWHCHSQPDFARGDGGPGMSGGFGFDGRKLDLSSYESIAGGYLQDDGKMASAFRKAADGTPMLVAVMLARQQEEAGRPGKLRGMPMGLPSMSPEQIQLVESWIAQGRPQ